MTRRKIKAIKKPLSVTKNDQKGAQKEAVAIGIGIFAVFVLSISAFYLKNGEADMATTTIAPAGQMENLPSKNTNLIRKVYVGTISQEITAADKAIRNLANVDNVEEVTYWKKIAIPEIKLADMPQVNVYVDDWRGEFSGPIPTNEVSFIDGYVWLKFAKQADSEAVKYEVSNYRVVVVK